MNQKVRINKISKFVKGAVGGAFDAWITTDPTLAVVWGAIKGGVSAVRTERAEVFIDYFETNFMLKQFNNPQIMDGVALTFEQFIRQRNENKRDIIKKIFLDFSTNADKEKFELERMYQAVNMISIDAIEFLSFLVKFVIPPNGNGESDISRVLTNFFRLEENKLNHKKYLGCSKEIFGELIGLGIVRMSGYAFISDPSLGVDQVHYSLTIFGNKFIKFLTN